MSSSCAWPPSKALLDDVGEDLQALAAHLRGRPSSSGTMTVQKSAASGRRAPPNQVRHPQPRSLSLSAAQLTPPLPRRRRAAAPPSPPSSPPCVMPKRKMSLRLLMPPLALSSEVARDFHLLVRHFDCLLGVDREGVPVQPP